MRVSKAPWTFLLHMHLLWLVPINQPIYQPIMNYILLSLLIPIAVVGTAVVDTVDNNNNYVGLQVGTTSGFAADHPAPRLAGVGVSRLAVPKAAGRIAEVRPASGICEPFRKSGWVKFR
jgi:hypothetical protein